MTSARPGERVGRDRVVVVLAGDLDRAGRARGAPGGCRRGGRTAACRCRRRAPGRGVWWPRQMPNTGTSPEQRARWRRPRRRPRRDRRGRSTGTRRRARGRAPRPRSSTPGRPRPAATPTEVAQDRALDAEVVGDDPERRVLAADGVGLGGGDVGDEVDAVGAGLGAPRRHVTAVSSVPNAPGMAPASRRWRVSRRVSMPAMPGTPWRTQEGRRGSPSAAPVAVAAGEVAHDDAAAERAGGSRRRRRSRRSCRCAGR